MANYRLGTPTTIDSLINTGTTSFTSLDVSGATTLQSSVSLGSTSSNLIFLYGVLASDLIFSRALAPNIHIKQEDAISDLNASVFILNSGKGGSASVISGGLGGDMHIFAGDGGAGSGSLIAGMGGNFIIQAGNAGTDAGGGGSDGGHIIIDAGIGSGAGQDGYISIGIVNAEKVEIGKTGSTSYIDGYLNIDGYATLSHDIGFTDVLALTQPGNTTTGADLRLRHLKFFSDNVPTNQASQSIYATGGDLVLSSPGQNIFIDAPEIYWSQNANIYTGGLNLQIGPAQNYIAMTYGINNTAVGYDFVSTINGASVGDNISLRHTYDVTQNDNNINNIAHKIVLTDQTDDGYTGGQDIGLIIDVGGGSNTTNQRAVFKKRAHAAFSGSSSWETTAAHQTTDATQTTLWSFTLADTTLYWFEASIIGRDVAGVERAMYGKKVLVYREGGSATIQGSVENLHNDIETSAGLDAIFTVNSNDIRLSVTGLGSTTINWTATISYQAVSGNT